MAAKSGRYFWFLNLFVIVIVFGVPAITHLLGKGVSDYRVQLDESAHYVTAGFRLDDGISGAVEFAPGESPRGGLLGGDTRPFLRPGAVAAKEFTITAKFDYTSQYDALMANPEVIPAIMLGRLGDNYEVYINGNLILSQWHVKDGKITEHKLLRDVPHAINPAFLLRGENTITFRIFGDPTTVDTGLTVADIYAIDDMNEFSEFDIPQIVFAGIYLAVAVTFAVFYLLHRESRLNLWFSLGALSLSLYTLFRMGVFKGFIPEYEISVRIELILLFSFAYLVTVLIYSVDKEKLNLPMKLFTGLYVLFFFALFMPGRQFLVDLITIYYFFLAPFLFYAFITSLCIPLARELKQSKADGGRDRMFFIRALSGTLRGNMLIAAFVPVVLSLADQMIYLFLSYQPLVLSEYGFLFFFANVTYALASVNAETNSKLVELSRELRTLVSERESQLALKSGEVEQVKSAQVSLLETVATEIRAPLGEIIGAIELQMLRSGLSDESASWLRRMLDAQRKIRKKLDVFFGEEDESEGRREQSLSFESIQRAGASAGNPGGTRHLFVINPKSFVTLNDLKEFLLSIEKCFSAGYRAEYKVYISRYPRDAYSAVHRYLIATPPDETARVYAVGGDGILFDCLNGLARFPNAELAPIPYGNANDFARSFGEQNMHLFRDIKLMSSSPSRLVDAILCGEQYALCSCSIGIEAKAVQVFSAAIEKINSGKARMFVPLIYNLGAVKALLDGSQNNSHYRLTLDGQDCSGDYLLVNTGNIALNGGNNTPNPLAVPDDGQLDLIMCKSASVLKSLQMLPAYTNGLFERFPDYIEHRRVSEIHCESDSLMSVILDGETFYTHSLDMKILPKAVKVVSPNGIDFADYSQPAKGAAK